MVLDEVLGRRGSRDRENRLSLRNVGGVKSADVFILNSQNKFQEMHRVHLYPGVDLLEWSFQKLIWRF